MPTSSARTERRGLMESVIRFLTPLWPLFVTGLLLLAATDSQAQQARPTDEITKLADGVYVYRHQFHQSIFITTRDGVIVTDPISPDAAAWLKAEIAKLTDQPVRFVIYSHDHADHIAGGTVFVDTAQFVSHWRAREAIRKGSRVETPLPTLTFTDRMYID